MFKVALLLILSVLTPWGSNTNLDVDTRPMQGMIDAVMQKLGNKPVGFDVKGLPFAAVTDNQSYCSLGHARFTLDNYCDGYIFQGPLARYEGVTVDPLSITEANLQEAIAHLPNPAYRKRVKTPEDIIAGIRRSADFKQRFRDVK